MEITFYELYINRDINESEYYYMGDHCKTVSMNSVHPSKELLETRE